MEMVRKIGFLYEKGIQSDGSQRELESDDIVHSKSYDITGTEMTPKLSSSWPQDRVKLEVEKWVTGRGRHFRKGFLGCYSLTASPYRHVLASALSPGSGSRSKLLDEHLHDRHETISCLSILRDE
jgi:hypothetical protein